jgi:3-dehydro-L-gulonate 2-dehydrogenase
MNNPDDNIRIPSELMRSEFLRILLSLGFDKSRAGKCAEIFTVNSLEGVYSHGINRFPRFVKNVRDGYVIPDAIPALIKQTGAIEQWDGNLGPGPLNAIFATDRAMHLAAENSIGLVAMARTNHWMRAGYYGWQAARKGFVFICWTNTCPNMPAWGAKDPRLGNNPMVFAVPYKNDAIVLDFAMSQYSYGKIESYNYEKMNLPYDGGFNKKGELTKVPGDILDSWRILPTGFWKGSALSLMLDILATVLSGGQSTHEVKSCMSETNVSQIFLAIQLNKLNNFPGIESSVDQIIKDLHKSVPADENSKIRYPGENIASIREGNLKNGIPVKREIWEKILSL